MCAALMSSDSTSPLTTAHRPSNMSVTSSRVYVSSTSLRNKNKETCYHVTVPFNNNLKSQNPTITIFATPVPQTMIMVN